MNLNKNDVKNLLGMDETIGTERKDSVKKPVMTEPRGYWLMMSNTEIVNKGEKIGAFYKKTIDEEWVLAELEGFRVPVMLLFKGSNTHREDPRRLGHLYIKNEKFNTVDKLTVVIKLKYEGKYAKNEQINAVGLLTGPPTQELPSGWDIDLDIIYPRYKDGDEWKNSFQYEENFKRALLNYLIETIS